MQVDLDLQLESGDPQSCGLKMAFTWPKAQDEAAKS